MVFPPQGPYIVVMDKLYDCPLGEDGYDGSITHNLRYSHFNPYKRNEPQTVWGNETRAVPLNDTYWVRSCTHFALLTLQSHKRNQLQTEGVFALENGQPSNTFPKVLHQLHLSLRARKF